MIEHTINPVLFNIGPLEIRWYGLMYVAAFLITFYYVRGFVRAGKLKITEKELDTLLGWLVIGMIIGARLFEVIFYEPAYFLANPAKIIAIWEGGLSFHGGLLGVVTAGYIFSRKKNVPVLKLADIFCVPIALGNALGRIGNFINGELYGVVTTLPWGVKFQGVEGVRHPTQLYEAAYNLVIFGILYPFRRKGWKDGKLFGLFLLLYSIFRFSVEFIKDLPVYGPLTMGQWLTIPVFIFGVYLVRRKS